MVQSRLLRRVRELQLNSVEQYSEYFFTSSNARRAGALHQCDHDEQDRFLS